MASVDMRIGHLNRHIRPVLQPVYLGGDGHVQSLTKLLPAVLAGVKDNQSMRRDGANNPFVPLVVQTTHGLNASGAVRPEGGGRQVTNQRTTYRT